MINYLRFKFKKLRVLLAWIGGLVLFLNSHISDQSFKWGVPIVLTGELIRLWASGFIERKGEKLATSGPFAYVRNPLYIGNFLIGFGIVAMGRNLFLMGVFLIGFAILYWGTVRKEEKDLLELFKESYADYRSAVPRLIPRLRPYRGRERTHYQWKLLLKHREHVTLLGIALLLTALYLWKETAVVGEFHWKVNVALGIVVALVAALVFELILRYQEKSNGMDSATERARE